MTDGIAKYRDGLSEEHSQFQRRYGPWQPFTPEQAKTVFDATGLSWWIAGGWAIEAFTGHPRDHEDIDVSMWRSDVPALVTAFESRYHVWAAGSGALTPLYGDRLDVPASADQVWIREHALAPWVADCVLNPDRDGLWVHRRDLQYAAPLEDVTWQRNGIRYLKPEIVLSFKAKLLRPKDNRDFAVTLPLLDRGARAFLADYLARNEPDHPWRSRL